MDVPIHSSSVESSGCSVFLSFHFTHCVGCMSHSGFNFYFLMVNEVEYLFMLLSVDYPLSLDAFSGFLPFFNLHLLV